ncbi:formyltransferase family protein [Christiangramia fulva]|nr:formyltransferase family protein [Christiangramia fulva]
MKTVLLTSNSYRHQYIARCLEEQTDLKLIISEEKSTKISDTSSLEYEDAEFQKIHLRKREESEIEFFGKEGFPQTVLQLKMAHGDINSELTLKVLNDIDPDYIILFGTSIIQNELLKAFPQRVINLHLGLSPWYKGSATNLFPLIDGRPELVGATIHLATAEVDAGGILHQLRPELEEHDSLHDIGNKVILQAGKILPIVLKEYESGKITPFKQGNPGKICRIKDLTTEKLRRAYQNISQGMIPEYLKKKEAIDADFPIVSNLDQ